MGLTKRKESSTKAKKANPHLSSKRAKKTIMTAKELIKYLLNNNISLVVGNKKIEKPEALLLQIARRDDKAEDKPREYLSTQEIADILNVSRPYVVKLLESKKMPSHKVGNQRRVKKEIVYAYKNKLMAEQEEALQELAEESAKLGLEY